MDVKFKFEKNSGILM